MGTLTYNMHPFMQTRLKTLRGSISILQQRCIQEWHRFSGDLLFLTSHTGMARKLNRSLRGNETHSWMFYGHYFLSSSIISFCVWKYPTVLFWNYTYLPFLPLSWGRDVGTDKLSLTIHWINHNVMRPAFWSYSCNHSSSMNAFNHFYMAQNIKSLINKLTTMETDERTFRYV